ncbi:phosphoserine aminotransferase [Metarhizium acridum CQMa 102]|uniref:phosphoserine transaminase n=1 Tax=Metarhizium acridum (strain CQMa 102) TaxID=655827 RepID=E9E7L7_METAQ|nr:phosphoserine aminotransferase [Metarhizium acridum CQMa 102]EFY88127.1 phosphoserine aminotransferase [Metarhizium acridum CQMa 102]
MPILEDAAKALVNFNDTGLGLAEHSHRSELATKIINEAKADLSTFLEIPDDYEVLFMQGGGSGQFAATAYNFAGAWVARKHKELGSDDGSIEQLKSAVKDLKIDYIITGGWSQKAAAEAERLFGPEHVNIVADSRKLNAGKFGIIPDEDTWNLSRDSAMVYYCDNETVHGVEFPGFPKRLEPGPDGPVVVADMSSNILSRKIPIRNFSAIFFGAQNNLGSTGITVVVIKKSFLAQPSAALLRQLALPIPPRALEYETIAKNNSLYNTLSIFEYACSCQYILELIHISSVYIAGRVLKKLLLQHPSRVQGQQTLSEQKAQLIYAALAAHPEIYHIIPHKSVRSRMNICFRIEGGDAAEEAFLKQGTAIGLTGLKGHRDLRGIRASNYNSIPLEGAAKLANYIGTFASQRGH